MTNSAGPNYANGTLSIDQALLMTSQLGYSGLTTGSSNVVSVSAGTTNGKRINRASVQAVGTTVAGLVNWFFNPSSTTLNLIVSTPVTAVTTGTSTGPFQTYEGKLVGFTLPTGTNLYASTTVTQTLDVTVEGAAF